MKRVSDSVFLCELGFAKSMTSVVAFCHPLRRHNQREQIVGFGAVLSQSRILFLSRPGVIEFSQPHLILLA